MAKAAVLRAPPPERTAEDRTADMAATAASAGLRYVDDRRPGLARRRTRRKLRSGKSWTPAFAIVDKDGAAVRDPETLDRIRKLAIPPAWEHVWICPSPQGHIQATGRDARRRKQYRYHPRWRAVRDETKYSRMIQFGQALPALRARVGADLRLSGLPQRKVLAAVVRLLETTFIRVGNEEYARQNQSFGLTTLKNRHVQIRKEEIRFHFRGKSHVCHDISVHDPSIARIVRNCRDLPGQELFQYVDADGTQTAIGSADVNEYIRQLTGEDFTAKDFRTWAGTVLAALALQEVAATHQQKKIITRPRRPTNRDVVRAIEQVAGRLGNTPSVCRKCYVHPAVIAAFMDGDLAAAMNKRPAGHPIRGARTLHPEEAAVLALLQKRLDQDKRGTGLERQLRRSYHTQRRRSRLRLVP